MRNCSIAIFCSFFSVTAFTQSQTFEIFGTINGEYESRIYLFFEGNYKQKDSIASEIKDGKFYFKASAPLPVQVRFHLDQQSYIQDVFVDNKKVNITCRNRMEINVREKDTLNVFTITEVSGSNMESVKRNVENELQSIRASAQPEDEKKQEYYDKLHDFVSRNPASKVSAYLIEKASALRYSEVYMLNSLLDSSVQNTYEGKTLAQLLKRLNNSKNKVTGKTFLDVILKDTSGNMVSTKSLRGKYVLVEFWASWCKPCRLVNPDWNILYSKLKDKNFEILGVSFDKDYSSWRRAIIKDGLTWIQVIDEKGFHGVLGEYYAIEAIPHNILLDKEGRIMGTGLSTSEVELMIDKAL